MTEKNNIEKSMKTSEGNWKKNFYSSTVCRTIKLYIDV